MELLVAAADEHPDLELVHTAEGKWSVKLLSIESNRGNLWEEVDSPEGSSVDTISVASEDDGCWGIKPGDNEVNHDWNSSNEHANSWEGWDSSDWSEKQDTGGWGQSHDNHS